jgi:hypothetical protein
VPGHRPPNGIENKRKDRHKRKINIYKYILIKKF